MNGNLPEGLSDADLIFMGEMDDNFNQDAYDDYASDYAIEAVMQDLTSAIEIYAGDIASMIVYDKLDEYGKLRIDWDKSREENSKLTQWDLICTLSEMYLADNEDSAMESYLSSIEDD